MLEPYLSGRVVLYHTARVQGMVVAIIVGRLEYVLVMSKGWLADAVDRVEVRIVMLQMRSLMRLMRLIEVRKGILLDVPKIVSTNSWRHGAIVCQR